MNNKAKWVIGLILGVTMIFAGWAYSSTNSRINRLENSSDQIVPLLYTIKEKVDNIERLLRDPTN